MEEERQKFEEAEKERWAQEGILAAEASRVAGHLSGGDACWEGRDAGQGQWRVVQHHMLPSRAQLPAKPAQA